MQPAHVSLWLRPDTLHSAGSWASRHRNEQPEGGSGVAP